MLKDLVLKNRSYRRFYEDEQISIDTLRELVDLARNTPSTVNSQALKYKLVCTAEENEKVFSTLSWAGLLKGKGVPVKGERPSAYIIVLCDLSVGKESIGTRELLFRPLCSAQLKKVSAAVLSEA